MKRVFVLGGGFAGIECAIFLRKRGFLVTLISERDYLYIYPTSIWIPVGKSSFDSIKISIDTLSNIYGFSFIVDSVKSVDTIKSSIVCQNDTYNYDYLVMAVGADKLHVSGIEQTLSICGAPTDSLKIKERFDDIIDKRGGKVAFGFGVDPNDSSSVRGGPAFELLFNFHNRLKKLGIRDNYTLTLFTPAKEPGKRMGNRALEMMDRRFKSLGIDIIKAKEIKEFQKSGVLFRDGTFLESDFTMFIPASRGHKVAYNSNLPIDSSGFIKINDYCEVDGCKSVFAIGDCASLNGPKWGAKQGHLAEIMARNVAYNIELKEQGKSGFKGYKEHINILCIMDSGDGALFVYRGEKRSFILPMPIVGHWLKRAWGAYYKYSKLKKIPRIPGL